MFKKKKPLVETPTSVNDDVKTVELNINESAEFKELKVNRLTFSTLGKSPIMVKFNDNDYCLLTDMQARELYEMLGAYLGK